MPSNSNKPAVPNLSLIGPPKPAPYRNTYEDNNLTSLEKEEKRLALSKRIEKEIQNKYDAQIAKELAEKQAAEEKAKKAENGTSFFETITGMTKEYYNKILADHWECECLKC